MLIIMKEEHSEDEVRHIVKAIENYGYQAHVLPGAHRTAIGVTGNHSSQEREKLSQLKGVKKVISVSSPYKLAGKAFQTGPTEVKVGPVTFARDSFVVMAGPCAVESEDQTLRIAKAVKARGAHILRGGAFKPRTSPYSFQGLGLEGLKILATARQETGLPVITEALDLASLEQVYEYADIIQIGTRNMQNFTLLKEVGKLNKPVMLKRGLSATIEEWLMAAEYIMNEGNKQILLCERGLRHYDPTTRNLLDLGAVLVLREITHLPVVIDPSHSLGKKQMVQPASVAALSIGAQGIIVDVHDRPEEALCDGPQAISPDTFEATMGQLKAVSKALNIHMQVN